MTAQDKPEGLLAGGEQVRAKASHIPTPEGHGGGEREPTPAELDELADIIDGEVGDERMHHMERAVWAFVASRRSSPRVEEDARFLLERLTEFELCDDAEQMARDWMGHIEPAIGRLRAALSLQVG